MKNLLNGLYVEELVNGIKNRKNSKIIMNDEFIYIINSLETCLSHMSCVGFVEECQYEILDGIKKSNLFKGNENIIVNYLNIRELTTDDKIISIVEALSIYSICFVVEPNLNMCLDIDYAELKKVFKVASDDKFTITTGAYTGLGMHEDVQKFAYINNKGELLTDSVKDFYEKNLIDCDFQKDDILFPYYCRCLTKIEMKKVIYKK